MVLEIISPEAILVSGAVTSVSVPGINGEFQMLNNHAPIVSALTKGKVKINAKNLKISRSTKKFFTQIDEENFVLPIESGTIELNNNKIIILVD